MIDYKPARLRRLAAFLADLYIALIPCFVMLFASTLLPGAIRAYVLFGLMFLGLGLWYCRDYLWGGRSPGKRLAGLSVVDRSSGAPAAGRQLIIKNLFTFLASFDGLVLLLSGKSIAERVTGTAVVRDKVSSPLVGKRFIKVGAGALVLGLILGGVVSFALNAAMGNESYAVSYTYLTESDTFARQEDAGTEPVLVGFSDSTHGTARSQSYTFETDSHVYTVVCHPDGDGTWTVCGDCTEFE